MEWKTDANKVIFCLIQRIQSYSSIIQSYLQCCFMKVLYLMKGIYTFVDVVQNVNVSLQYTWINLCQMKVGGNGSMLDYGYQYIALSKFFVMVIQLVSQTTSK